MDVLEDQIKTTDDENFLSLVLRVYWDFHWYTVHPKQMLLQSILRMVKFPLSEKVLLKYQSC